MKPTPANYLDSALDKYVDIFRVIGINLYFLDRKDEAFEPLSIATKKGDLLAEIVLGLYYQSTTSKAN